MYFFKIFLYVATAWFADTLKNKLLNLRAKHLFIQNTIRTQEIAMITHETPDTTLNTIWDVAQKAVPKQKNSKILQKIQRFQKFQKFQIFQKSQNSTDTHDPFQNDMTDMLISSPKIPMLTKDTHPSIFSHMYSLGKNYFTQYNGRPIWRSFFIQALISSHLIPCIQKDTAHDILDTICDIVEHTITPEVAARQLFSKLLASSIDIPMINYNTEKVVFESLFNIAASILYT